MVCSVNSDFVNTTYKLIEATEAYVQILTNICSYAFVFPPPHLWGLALWLAGGQKLVAQSGRQIPHLEDDFTLHFKGGSWCIMRHNRVRQCVTQYMYETQICDTIGKTWATSPTTLFHRTITISYGCFKRDRDRPMKQSWKRVAHVSRNVPYGRAHAGPPSYLYNIWHMWHNWQMWQMWHIWHMWHMWHIWHMWHMWHIWTFEHLTQLTHVTHVTHLTHLTHLTDLNIWHIWHIWHMWHIWHIWQIWTFDTCDTCDTFDRFDRFEHLTQLTHVTHVTHLTDLTDLNIWHIWTFDTCDTFDTCSKTWAAPNSLDTNPAITIFEKKSYHGNTNVAIVHSYTLVTLLPVKCCVVTTTPYIQCRADRPVLVEVC
jgi:hypothetical protein